MNSIRRRLTYANVVSTICLFLLLGGATAFAAKQLAKNSVGTKQLKKNAVTSVKVKDGAIGGSDLADGSVTGAKLANGAVDADKIANGAITGAKLGAGSVGAANLADGSVTAGKLDPQLFVPHVVARLTGTQQLPLPGNGSSVIYPLDSTEYVQAAGEDDILVASFSARLLPGCKTSRGAEAILRIADPGSNSGFTNIGIGGLNDSTGNGQEVALTGQIAPIQRGPLTFQAPSQPTTRHLQLGVQISCGTGSTAGGTITGAQIDVIGFR